ncbi:MAG: translocation/assembly module TamB domain-containing protein [Bacteroidetes bacterium]|nr:translocation/assembly module TamB domain-containing protein [Bacteroidota bacterium]
MSDTANTSTENEIPRKRKSWTIRILRAFVLLGLSIFLLLIALIIFSETETFRSMLRDVIVDAADSTLNAQLSIDQIDGNLFSGWKISGVRLTDAHGPIAEVESIVLRYNIFRIPWKVVTVRELTLNAPRIFITRAAGRDWNINTLVRPSREPEDTTSTPFDWDIRVEYLRILDGMLLVYDSSTTGPARRDRLDAAHMQLTDLNMALSAEIRDTEKHLVINRFSWVNVLGEVGMQNLSGDVLLRKDGVEINGLSIQTERSGLLLSASVDSVDLLEGFDSDLLAELPFRVRLEAPAVDLRDLQYFLPPLEMLGGVPALVLDARGTLTDLQISALRLDAAESRIAFTGWLRDIMAGADMTIDVRSEETRIHGADIPLLLPGIDLMDFSGIGTAEFSLLRFNGRPLDFEVELDMQSDAGAIAGRMQLDLTSENMAYDGLLRTRGLDIGRALGRPDLTSSLSVQAGIHGDGTRIGNIVGALNLRVDSSRFQQYGIEHADLQVDVRRDSLTLDLASRFGGSSIVMDGGMSFQPDSITGFRITSETASLDLGWALNDDALSSDLTFHLIAQGDGVDLSSSSGSVTIAFEPSRLRDITIEADTFRLVLQQSPDEPEYLLLESIYADARIDGRFDFPRFIDYLSLQTDSLTRALDVYRFAPDTTADVGQGEDGRGAAAPALASVADTSRFMDVTYSIKLKNPERIARYFNASTFLLRGDYRGSIRGGMQGFGIDGELKISDFYYVDSAHTWLAAGVRCTYDIQDLRLHAPLEQLNMDMHLQAGDLNIDGLRLRRSDVRFSFTDVTPRLRIRSMLDTLIDIDVEASAQYADYGIDVRFPRVELRYLREPWRNDGDMALRVDSGGISVQRFVLTHDAMRLSLTGQRSRDGSNNFTLYADSLDIGMVEYFVTASPEAREGAGFTGTGFVQANFTGTDTAPLMAADVFIDSLAYRDMHFGELIMEARYFSGLLELYSELAYRRPDGEDENVFFVSGTVPVGAGEEEQPTVHESQKIGAGQGERAANLRVQMKAFPLALIEEFLGLFSPLDGTADADVTLSGTSDEPSINGFLSVQNAHGRFVFNNMEYLLGMRIEATGQDIRIEEATIKNIPGDWSAGRMTASGTISTEAFSISTFDLSMEGKLQVLKPASRSALRALYGDLYISTGDEKLTYRGRLDRSILLGKIVIEEGNLISPLQQSAGAANAYSDFTYVVVDDTTKTVRSSLSSGRFGRSRDGDNSEDEATRVRERSVLEGLTYDLTLNTNGLLRVEIPFSVLQEELNAALDIDNLKVNNWGGGGMKFVGDVELGNDSYYIFFGKRMTATGSLRFTRDPMNPDLDLKAVYSDYYIDPRSENEIRRQVYVIITITGTKEKPSLTWDMRWDNVDGEPIASAGDVESDAFSFLLFGVFAKDFTTAEGDRSSLLEKSPELINAVGSSLASSAVTQFVARAGLSDFIKRVEFAGLGTQESRFKVTGELGRAVIIYDGKFSNLESSNVTAEFPLSRILGIPWTNLVIQVSRKTINDTYENPSEPSEDSVWEIKILERFSF